MRSTKTTATLLSHQKEGVEWILRTPKCLLADEAGLGKTPQALDAVSRVLATEEPHVRPGAFQRKLCRVLWLTDASLTAQTAEEASRWAPELTVLTGSDPEMRNGIAAQRLMQQNYPQGVDLLILSYATYLSRKESLGRYSPSMLVLDEVSRLKGHGKQLQAVRALSERTPRVLSMTATPLENDPTELWAILRVTDTPDLWVKPEFEKRFVSWRTAYVDQWGNQRKVPDGWLEDQLEDVRDYLSGVVLRRTHEDVGTERPLRLSTPPIDVLLTPEQECAYEEARKAGGRAAVRHMEVASLLSPEESPFSVALIRELDKRPGESAIVYCETLAMLDEVEQCLSDHGVSTCRIEGKINDSDRRDAIERHRSGQTHVLLASRVLEYGLNLQHCRLLISLDTSWNPAREAQREGRICRLGSPHTTYEHVVIRPKTALAEAKASKLDNKLRCAELVGLA